MYFTFWHMLIELDALQLVLIQNIIKSDFMTKLVLQSGLSFACIIARYRQGGFKLSVA